MCVCVCVCVCVFLAFDDFVCVCVCVSECVFIPSREDNDEIQKEKKMT